MRFTGRKRSVARSSDVLSVYIASNLNEVVDYFAKIATTLTVRGNAITAHHHGKRSVGTEGALMSSVRNDAYS